MIKNRLLAEQNEQHTLGVIPAKAGIQRRSTALDAQHQNATKVILWFLWHFATSWQVRFENALARCIHRVNFNSLAVMPQAGLRRNDAESVYLTS